MELPEIPEETINAYKAYEEEKRIEYEKKKYVEPYAYLRDDEQHALLQSEIDKICAKYGAAGVLAAYVKDGVLYDTFAYGYATKGVSAMTPDTKVRVASITKLLVSLGAYFSVEDGTMTLDGSIGDALGYSIGVHSSKDVLSARSIMTHTSSTGYLEGNGGSYNYIRNMLESGRGVQYINSGNLDNWCYNNFAFYVLGMAVEIANNKEFDAYMREKLFDEMNIDAGVWAGDMKEPEKTATIYTSAGAVGLSYDYQISRHSEGIGVNGAPFAGN